MCKQKPWLAACAALAVAPVALVVLFSLHVTILYYSILYYTILYYTILYYMSDGSTQQEAKNLFHAWSQHTWIRNEFIHVFSMNSEWIRTQIQNGFIMKTHMDSQWIQRGFIMDSPWIHIGFIMGAAMCSHMVLKWMNLAFLTKLLGCFAGIII